MFKISEAFASKDSKDASQPLKKSNSSSRQVKPQEATKYHEDPQALLKVNDSGDKIALVWVIKSTS